MWDRKAWEIDEIWKCIVFQRVRVLIPFSSSTYADKHGFLPGLFHRNLTPKNAWHLREFSSTGWFGKWSGIQRLIWSSPQFGCQKHRFSFPDDLGRLLAENCRGFQGQLLNRKLMNRLNCHSILRPSPYPNIPNIASVCPKTSLSNERQAACYCMLLHSQHPSIQP